MAKTITTTTTVSLSGDGFAASPLFTESVQNTAGSLPFQFTTSPSTNTQIAVPSTALGALIVPPLGNTTPLTLKGASGDTGIAIDPGYSTRLKFQSGAAPANIFMFSTGAVTVEVIWL